MNLRTNGYEFHMDLTTARSPGPTTGVHDDLRRMGQGRAGYITDNHAALDWQDAAALLVQGKAANYVMGNFAVGVFKEGGMTNDNLGFMPFPTINPDVPRAEEAPTDTIHIPSGATNVEDAKTFLAFIASADAQTKLNAAIGQLPINKDRTVAADDPFIRPASSCCRPRRAASPSSSTATLRPKWRRSAWKASRSSWSSPRSSTRSSSGSKSARQRIYK